MQIPGVDFSEARPGGAALAAAGKRFVMRYIPYGGYPKGLTAAEVADYRAHGIDIGLVFESLNQRILGGVITGVDQEFWRARGQAVPSHITPQYAGMADAWKSDKEARALGFPDATVIYFGVDYDAPLSDQPSLDAYLQGAASIIGAGRVGVYAGYRPIYRCHLNGTAQWFWQTYAWSYGTVASFAHVVQYLNGQVLNGVQVDLCYAQQSNFGQWPAGAPAGGDVNSFTVPTGPSVADVPNGTWLYDNDALASSTGNINVSPGRTMPLVGTLASGVQMVGFVNSSGVPTGKAYFVKAGVLVNVRPVPAPAPPADTTPFDQAYVDAQVAAAVAAQVAADAAAVDSAKAAAADSDAAAQAAQDALAEQEKRASAVKTALAPFVNVLDAINQL